MNIKICWWWYFLKKLSRISCVTFEYKSVHLRVYISDKVLIRKNKKLSAHAEKKKLVNQEPMKELLKIWWRPRWGEPECMLCKQKGRSLLPNWILHVFIPHAFSETLWLKTITPAVTYSLDWLNNCSLLTCISHLSCTESIKPSYCIAPGEYAQPSFSHPFCHTHNTISNVQVSVLHTALVYTS